MKLKLFATLGAVALAGTLSAGAQLYVHVGPPPPVREVVPPPPHPGWVWHPGYQRWDGARYVWVPGNYVVAPRGHGRWIPGHWRNTRRGYVFVEGHWA